MKLSAFAASRYTTKSYDPSKKVPADQIADLIAMLQQAPSSVNSQPTHFIVAGDAAGKARVAKGVENGFAYNVPKVLDASHVIVLCTRIDLDETHLNNVLEKEAADGRFKDEAARTGQHNLRMHYVSLHREHATLQQWMEKQTYIALGTLLLGAAALGIDATPMEGFDPAALDAELGLREKGYTSLVMVSLGYRSETDFNAALPKSRLKEADLVTYL